jgi:hypothetical protein
MTLLEARKHVRGHNEVCARPKERKEEVVSVVREGGG